MSYKKNILSNFINQIIKIALGFFTSVIIARVLGPDKQGYIAYILLVFGLIGDYGHLGINNAATYFQKRSKYSEEKVYSVNLTYLFLIFGLIVTVMSLLKFNKVIFNEYNYYFFIGGLLLVIGTFILNIANSFFIGNERIIELNKYTLGVFFIQSFLTILLWIIGKLNIYSYFLLRIGSTLINSIILLRKLNVKYTFSIDTKLLKLEFKYGIILYLAALFIYLNYRADQFMIKKMLGSAQLGIYSIGVTLAELVFLIPNSVGTAFIGKLYNTKEKNDRKLTALTVKYTFYICIFIVLIGICMVPLIPIIYGKKYLAATTVTTILFIGVIFASIGKVAYGYFITKGRPQVHLILTSVCLVSNIIMNIYFIPKLGINGAAIASTISYTCYGISYIIYFIKREKFLLKDFFMFNELDKEMLRSFLLKLKSHLNYSKR